MGKSTILSALTGTHSEVAAYEFTTLTCIPGIIHYNEAKIQLLDLPGIIEGAAEGRGAETLLRRLLYMQFPPPMAMDRRWAPAAAALALHVTSACTCSAPHLPASGACMAASTAVHAPPCVAGVMGILLF